MFNYFCCGYTIILLAELLREWQIEIDLDERKFVVQPKIFRNEVAAS